MENLFVYFRGVRATQFSVEISGKKTGKEDETIVPLCPWLVYWHNHGQSGKNCCIFSSIYFVLIYSLQFFRSFQCFCMSGITALTNTNLYAENNNINDVVGLASIYASNYFSQAPFASCPSCPTPTNCKPILLYDVTAQASSSLFFCCWVRGNTSLGQMHVPNEARQTHTNYIDMVLR